MKTFRANFTPLSPFGTPPKGDTFFGQLCWAIRNRHGEERLTALLEGYTANHPFAVVSDAFPAFYLPRPTLPGHYFDEVKGTDRKTAKKLAWLPQDKFTEPVAHWLEHCQSGIAVPGGALEEHPQPHNTLNRGTGTTGEGQFAPYTMNQLWYGQRTGNRNAVSDAQLDLYVVLDKARLSGGELRQLLEDIGMLGFGRDAGIGLGKFHVGTLEAFEFPSQRDADAWLTLAPCAPQGLAWDAARSFYTVFTRFGRHGDIGVHFGNPFKSPVLLADSGSVLTPREYQHVVFAGQGLGGDGSLSKAIPETVHQGYAPVLGICLPKFEEAAA